MRMLLKIASYGFVLPKGASPEKILETLAKSLLVEQDFDSQKSGMKKGDYRNRYAPRIDNVPHISIEVIEDDQITALVAETPDEKVKRARRANVKQIGTGPLQLTNGHTLTELCAVIAIIGLLAGLALPALATAYSHSRDLSQASAILYDAKIEAALDERPDGSDGFEVLQVLDGISPGQLARILRENRTAVATSEN